MEADYQIIETVTGLERIVRIFEREKTIAIDLEADSMFHFKEKVCLIQVASKNRSIVIDPLQIKDLSSIKSIFAGHDIQKIFHGADYDVRSLYRDFNIEINNLFDTELACRFLGIKETGLEAALKKFFKINLDKKYQKKDWSKRPLPQEMLDYAASDVIYLVPMAEILEKELDSKGRLSWVHEECNYLSKVRPALSDDEPLFLKFKGAGRLKPRSLAVLEALLQFRKKIAEKKDKPLFKIIGNNDLMKITMSRPVTLLRLKGTKALSNRQISIYGNALVETINKVIKTPEDKLPAYPRKKAPVLSHRVPKRVKELKKWRYKKAKELEVDSAIICNNALINSIAVLNPSNSNSLETIKNMKNWQKKEFGNEIIAVLSKVR
ncbi:MAG: HRDC domain-containing protein [Desulfobacterales bacterium]